MAAMGAGATSRLTAGAGAGAAGVTDDAADDGAPDRRVTYERAT